VSWPGGKRRLVDHILPFIKPHKCYCEPFAGGLAVLLAKPRSGLEVINDLNGDLVAFYRCVKYHREELLTEMDFVLNSREEFNDFRSQKGLTDIQRAARWYFRNKVCFGGSDMEVFGTAALGGGGSHGSRASRMETIRALNIRLDRACIEHLDWKECIRRYDRPTTFFFLDPPYTECKPKMYDGWTNANVQELRDILGRAQGKWLVTLNDTAPIRAIFAGCAIKRVTRAMGINNRTPVQKVYHELIIRPR
jgi:DNA adenine methylase